MNISRMANQGDCASFAMDLASYELEIPNGRALCRSGKFNTSMVGSINRPFECGYNFGLRNALCYINKRVYSSF